jgi:hypothetical protein
MHDRHPLAIRLALAAGLLLVLCVGGSAAVLIFNPRPHTHAEQVAYELGWRGVRHGPISFGEMWPDQTNLQYGSYAGPVTMSVTVVLSDGSMTNGWVECRSIGNDCTLTLRRLDIRDAALPDLVADEQPAWLRWVTEQVEWFNGYSAVDNIALPL